MNLYPENLFGGDCLRTEYNVNQLCTSFGLPNRCLFYSIPGFTDGLVVLQWYVDDLKKSKEDLKMEYVASGYSWGEESRRCKISRFIFTKNQILS